MKGEKERTVELRTVAGEQWRLSLHEMPVDREVAEFLRRQPPEQWVEWLGAALAVGVAALGRSDIRQWQALWGSRRHSGRSYSAGSSDGNAAGWERWLGEDPRLRGLVAAGGEEGRSPAAVVVRRIADQLAEEVRRALDAWVERVERRTRK